MTTMCCGIWTKEKRVYMPKDKIVSILPVGENAVLIENITELFILFDEELDKEKVVGARGKFRVTPELCRDHFPGTLFLPFHTLLEAISQIGAVATLINQNNDNNLPRLTFIVQSGEFRITQEVRPDQTLTLECWLVAGDIKKGKISGRALLGSEVVATASLTFYTAPLRNLQHFI